MMNPLNNLAIGPMGARNVQPAGSIVRAGVKTKKPRRPKPLHKPLGLPAVFSHGIS